MRAWIGDPQTDEDSHLLVRVLAVAGSGAIAAWIVVQFALGREQAWVAGLAFVAIISWDVAVVLPARWESARMIAWFVAITCGSLVACGTLLLGYIPALGSVSVLIRRPRTVGPGIAAAVLSLVLVTVSAFLFREPIQTIGSLAGLVIVVLIAFSRRQYWMGQRQARILLEEQVALEQERADVAALEERSRIARDIHDVLAHSLGGLVLQLSAVEALLEAGRTSEVAPRVAAARELAAEGLDEARRAVSALRDPEAALDLREAIEQLVATHHSLGATADLRQSGTPGRLEPRAAGALRSAAQEVLSNARRHAPGAATALSLEWDPTGVSLRAATTLVGDAPRAVEGGGRGLRGLQERVEAVGGVATAGVQGNEFVVLARVPRVREDGS